MAKLVTDYDNAFSKEPLDLDQCVRMILRIIWRVDACQRRRISHHAADPKTAHKVSTPRTHLVARERFDDETEPASPQRESFSDADLDEPGD